MSRRNFSYAEKYSKLDTAGPNSTQVKPITRCMFVALLNAKDIKKTLKSLRGNTLVITKEYESDQHQTFHQHARRKWNVVFKVQRENYFEPGILQLTKIQLSYQITKIKALLEIKETSKFSSYMYQFPTSIKYYHRSPNRSQGAKIKVLAELHTFWKL